jgi:potassium-transporting ATPase potassium-binding subunit
MLLLFGCTALLLKPLGSYMARIYNGQFTFMEPILGPIEEMLYKIIGIDEKKEMIWQEYAFAMLSCSFLGFLFLFGILRFQYNLPLNPENFPNLNNDLAFNIAVSFVTNTNWQAYGGESTLSYFSQMFGLGVQNFLSASMGMAVAVAFIRGIIRKNSPLIGNFWVDLTRGCLYILLPLSIILSILLGSQGVIQNYNHYVNAPALQSLSEKSNDILDSRLIPGGPVASQVAIKQLGSNGGGFFNVNSAHPFENPTPLSNFLELLAIILIPAALCYTFGVMVGDKRQAWLLLTAMTVIFLPLFLFSLHNEQMGNPLISNEFVDQTLSPYQPGGNMEGKELRFGILNSTLWTSATTATSNGSVNSSLDSYTPLGGVVPLLFMLLGEIIYGGVGAGLFTMLIFVFITVFISGLMIGRTPEYLGKKIEFFEMKMSILTILIPIMTTLFGLAIASLTPSGQAGTFNPGAQGFSELFYAFTSTTANNGSSFAGINANTPFYNTILGLTMLFGRYWVFITVLAIAGSLAEKNSIPATTSTLSTHTFFFLILLVGVILLIGPLTYTPALTLGPVIEYFQWVK